MKRTTVDSIRVYRSPLDHRRGQLVAGPFSMPCALGGSGATHDKREGDGASPVGRFRVLQAFYRADRLPRPRTLLPLTAIGPEDGWCDDPSDRRYNRPIRLPDPARHERMRREDGLYDVVLDLDFNRSPIHKGRGSAIFLHCAKPGLMPTEGCVAVGSQAIARLPAPDRGRNLVESVRLW